MPKPVSVLILSWEYPPLIIGGIAPHVYELSRHLKDKWTEIHVVTNSAPQSPIFETEKGVFVHRVNSYENLTDFEDWVLQFNLAIVDYVKTQLLGNVRFDFIHAHDWLVGYAAILLRHQLNLPLVTTIHATEYGRNQGLFTPQQQGIHSIENELVSLSDKVIVCSSYMKHEVCNVHAIDEQKMEVIPNGIDLSSLQLKEPHTFQRELYAQAEEKIVLFIGRLVKEKGVQVLLESAREVLSVIPDCKFIIAGRGPMLSELEGMASEINSQVLFTGFIKNQEKNFLLEIADLCVFPSLYEPFGIVAIEAMGSGTPIVVSDVGGLAEIVEDGRTGLTSVPGDSYILAENILRILQDSSLASRIAEAGRTETVLHFDWRSIALRTKEVYSKLNGVKL
ncbi:glycosyltransferase family 4 protein [Paenibacillus sp. FSL F4-0125]|uniref:glycosyltransferase family 4 protein n=1 Tax=Paenibacillus sp. FSL F4-0125 TaxID=2954730 RepID=UPI0030FC0120